MLAPAPILFLLFMGSQERFFGRWLMPVFPMVCLLAALRACSRWRARGARGGRRCAPTLLGARGASRCAGRGSSTRCTTGWCCRATDTRNLARDWMVAHVPAGTKIVVEPVVPDGWAQDIGHPSPLTANGNRWVEVPDEPLEHRRRRAPSCRRPGRVVNIEDYERTLRPELIDVYERQGYCWVVVGSTQRGRAEVEPDDGARARSPTTASSSAAPDVVYRGLAVPHGRAAR